MSPCVPVTPLPGSRSVVFKKLNRAPFVCPPSARAQPMSACIAPADGRMPSSRSVPAAHWLTRFPAIDYRRPMRALRWTPFVILLAVSVAVAGFGNGLDITHLLAYAWISVWMYGAWELGRGRYF